jgi:peroxiredoxin
MAGLTRRWFILCPAALLAASLAFGAETDKRPRVPDLALQDLDGKKVTLSELRGKPVVLAFWTSWSERCHKELPRLAALHDDYGDRVHVITIALDTGRSGVAAAVTAKRLKFPVLWAQPSSAELRRVVRQYRIQTIPAVMVIDTDGRIVARKSSLPAEDELRGLLAEAGMASKTCEAAPAWLLGGC